MKKYTLYRVPDCGRIMQWYQVKKGKEVIAEIPMGKYQWGKLITDLLNKWEAI